MGDRLVMAMGSKDLADSTFLESKVEVTLRVPQFGPQNPAYGGAKISRDSIQSVCLQGVLAVPLLASILGS